MLKIAYYTAVDAYLSVFSAAYENTEPDEVEMKAWHKRIFSSDDREALIQYLEIADVFIVQLMGGKESMLEFDRIINNCPPTAKLYIYGTTPSAMELALRYNTVAPQVAKQLFAYISIGGQDNIYQMIRYLQNTLVQPTIAYKLPSPLAMYGIYHHKHGTFNALAAYKKHLSSKPTIGIAFYRNYYINEDHIFIDYMIETLESYGANVIPVFYTTVRNDGIDNLEPSEILKKYFMDSTGEPVIDVLINLIMFSIGKPDEQGQKYLGVLDVPVLQGIMCTDSKLVWESENYGLSPSSLSLNIALPEIDGSIIALPVATKEINRQSRSGIDIVFYRPLEERIHKLSKIALRYAVLRHKPNAEKRIAILMHNYPAKNETIGSAFGLDTHKSIINIMASLKKSGYKVNQLYEDASQLMDELLTVCTNHEAWFTEEQIMKSSKLGAEHYLAYYKQVSSKVRNLMENEWGEAPGNSMVYQDSRNKKSLLIPGVKNGNIFIGIQPKRSDFVDNSEAVHSPDLAIGHHYYGYYQWLKNVFKADAIIHVGKHGSLEWLPGKSVALSCDCHSDVALDELPNIYPYIINNPGEGTQAKRRSRACLIGHLEPAMINSDLYDEFLELEGKLDEYMEVTNFGKLPSEALMEDIEVLLAQSGLSNDFDASMDTEKKLSQVHTYLEEMKDTLINNGLHVLGEVPEGEPLIHFLAALTRIPSKDMPSLREEICRAFDLDYDVLLNMRATGSFSEKAIAQRQFEKINQTIYAFIEGIVATDHMASFLNTFIETNAFTNRVHLEAIADLLKNSLIPRLNQTTNEIDHVIAALDGRFVPPGPSGAPTRGQTEILPTGRNFYSLNPYAIPSKAAWKTGVALSDALIGRFLEENGKYPEEIGFVLFGSPTIRTRGEDVAQIMHLMGVRPVWQSGNQNVKSIEIIPLDELNRPRIDVTVRITGFFRDAFPNIVEMLDEAIGMIAKLDEPDHLNPIKKHIETDTDHLMKVEGLDKVEGMRKASYRVFGAKPGAYGTGINTLVNSKNWEKIEDLREMYLSYGGYAYGQGISGVPVKNQFKERLGKIELAVKNIDTKETDVLANDDNYSYLGGMVAAASSLREGTITGYVGDSSDPRRVKVKDIREETRFVIRTKLLNPKWYNALKKHGFKGAADISSAVDYTFGWDATTNIVDDHTYERITDAFLKDEAFSSWMTMVNPWALQNITERLLEAIQRGLWDASDETKEFLMDSYLKTESALE